MKAIPRIFVCIHLIFSVSACDWPGSEESYASDPVLIPDRALLYDLITLGIDTNGDSIISYAEAEAITSLDITNYYGNYITDATGLEAFVNLTSLTFRCNVVDKLDLSKNTKLKQIIAYDNALQTIDVSECTQLEELHVGSEGFCFKNKLSSLDVSNNAKLKILRCGNNQISELKLSQNPELEILECHLNLITEIDLSNNRALVELTAWDNQLANLDVSNCPSLKVLDFRGNNIKKMDLSKNESLEELDACRNFISSIHLCSNKALTRILLSEMATLTKVCVWTLPFPPESVYFDISGVPGITIMEE